MLREKLLRDLRVIFESMGEDVWGLIQEDTDFGKPSTNVRIGLATYGPSGYKVVHDDNNPEIQNTLQALYPQVARGSGFGKFEKTGPNSLGVTVPTGQTGAGGMGGFVSLCIFGAKDPQSLSKAARRVIDKNLVPQYRYALEKIAK